MKCLLSLSFLLAIGPSLAGMFGCEQVQEQPGQQLSILLNSGVKLDARYYSPGKMGPAILLLSMCDPSTTQAEWEIVATDLQERGFHVLTFDYQSFGSSEGNRPRGWVRWKRRWHFGGLNGCRM